MYTRPRPANGWLVRSHGGPNSSEEVIPMKRDLLLGILVGAILGLMFTPTLTPYLPFIVITAVLMVTKVVH